MQVCREKSCVALATVGPQCAAHAAGYASFDGAGEMRCTNCRALFRKGEWYQHRDGGDWHAAKTRKTHPDVIAEREKAAASR